ncbi:MAG TPA: lipoyl(octanoyl) transferase LipB [Ramlibacter sp.]|nr:lipoyl(octanoyl) transferase LipB [Ramlibacter sp.]
MHVVVRGRVAYEPTYEAMRAFNDARDASTADELWVCEHPPVFTQGLAGKPEHVHDAGGIPVVQTNRGGQVTYHGPGQVVAYPLIDLQRAGYFVKEYVYRVEEAVIRTLREFGVTGHRVKGAPGIYVKLDDPFGHSRVEAMAPDFSGLGKIAALGVKVSRGCAYHGVALNVAMDLEPFGRIDPCGYATLETADLSTIGISTPWEQAAQVLAAKLVTHLAP